MDMSPAALMATNYCGLLITITVAASCLTNFISIKDIYLQISIGLFFVTYATAIICSTFAWKAFQDHQLSAFTNCQIAASVAFVLAFLSQGFYSLRRTCMVYVSSPRWQMGIPLGMMVIQAALQFMNGAFWSIDMVNYHGAKTSDNTSRTSIASIVWILCTEPIYFGLLQYKIVQCAAYGQSIKTRAQLYALWGEAALRLALYFTTIVMSLLTISDHFPQLAYWSMVNVLPANVGLILLTDIARFQRVLGSRRAGASTGKGASHQGPSIRTDIIEAALKDQDDDDYLG
ncbi:hypothetical protein HK104_002133 [Borealophlyctis nickersoniae]|nr:hypothetical protein HK104_002133 [Borealophlyctis nickersoniae]